MSSNILEFLITKKQTKKKKIYVNCLQLAKGNRFIFVSPLVVI